MASSLSLLLSFLLYFLTVSASSPPDYSPWGWTMQWYDDFSGWGGTMCNTGIWNVIDGTPGFNQEQETYRYSTDNVHQSGDNGGSLELIPWKDGSVPGGWTSGRIESQYEFTPPDGMLTLVEANIRFGNNPSSNKQGIWPAFWMLGSDYRDNGVQWPQCGEIDVMENINGQNVGYGTGHCGSDGQGGPCNEPTGLNGQAYIPDLDYHNWRVVWDRTSGDWTQETITWYLDGNQFQQIVGGNVGDFDAWSSMAHNSMYIIFNVAVGGVWQGPPNDDTWDGYGAQMEIQYVAQYTANQWT